MLIVITGHADNQWIRERRLSDSGWNETVKAVASGEWTDITSIYWASTGLDATDLIASEVAAIWAERDEPLADWQKDFLQANGVTWKRRLPPQNIREIGRNATVAEPLRTIINSFAGGFGR